MIEPHLGSETLIELDSSVIAAYRDKRLAMKARNTRTFSDGTVRTVNLPKLVSSATVRHEPSFIRRVIEQARREWGVHLPAGNPVDLVKLPKPGKPRDRRLVGDEETRLLCELDQISDPAGRRNHYLQSAFIIAI